METSRFFVANLPSNCKEDDLSRLFQDYGTVTYVDLKTKKNLVDPDDVSLIAFVTVEISNDDAQYCLKELNWQKVRGAQIKVSLARESFLDRLKREREEAKVTPAEQKKIADDDGAATSALLLQPKKLPNRHKTFDEDADLENDDEIASDLMITKKRAASSLHHGKIVIESFNVTPLHVIQPKPEVKQLNSRCLNADQKRKESLIKMKQGYQDKKAAIQQALMTLDTPPAKKIKFSDAEESNDDDNVASNVNAKSSTNIFGSDDETETESNLKLNLKPEHFGKKGEKLVQLQSRQSIDPRFKINEHFVDDDDDDDDDDIKQNENDDKEKADSQLNTDERNWQMDILKQVVGGQLDTANATQMAAKSKKMLRFDPAKDDHQKYLRPEENAKVDTKLTGKKTKNQKKNKKEINDDLESEEADESATKLPQVSQDVFYEVTDTLAESLKTRGDGFSLLNMFGRHNEILQQREEQLNKIGTSKILVNKLDNNELQPFYYDSSSAGESDDDDDAGNEQAKDKKQPKVVNEKLIDENNAVIGKRQDGEKSKQKAKVNLETFFIARNDKRLKEGAKFFKINKIDAAAEDYEDVRKRLNQLIKTKITKTKKQLGSLGKIPKGKLRKRNLKMSKRST